MVKPYELPLYYLNCPHTLSLCSVPLVTFITLTGVCRQEDDGRDAHSKILSLLKTLPYPGRCFPERNALELGSGAPCCQDPTPAHRALICLPVWTPLRTKSQQEVCGQILAVAPQVCHFHLRQMASGPRTHTVVERTISAQFRAGPRFHWPTLRSRHPSLPHPQETS